MRAMVLHTVGEPLELQEVPKPRPGRHQLLLEILTCGICRTDLHIIDGELDKPTLPLILGHQIVGIVREVGSEVSSFKKGDKVGVPWLGHTCGNCEFCLDDRENLCDNARFTGYDRDGGFAEYATADAHFCFPIPEEYPAVQAAPLLCAGLIGYRSLRKAGAAQKIGFYGFGSAAHILAQVADYQDRQVYAFTRPGDRKGQEFARSMGTAWAGSSEMPPPQKLDAAIIFAPVGKLVPHALKAVKKGGKVVCAGIHMSDIPGFPYRDLWGERSIESVANLTRQDGVDFMQLAPEVPVESSVQTYPLEEANEALEDLRAGTFNGSAVLVVNEAS
ncbi:zinc-dependent alcohol dehydrogenase family protein [Fodinibius sediminis]|uniref:Alcohol dehydrogenase, propanol-preferring n=1 Tax=Fodinibius sediminis TaxID=1214077 RepID=A0A521ANM2_9BACT|nr:zinc-dependent alcohol dehydrogenase family protein [Fodinibius sediminis]SMO36351.1 alcohol dehydrogenase, propanol-preferring [Fodinibius sediminis]